MLGVGVETGVGARVGPGSGSRLGSGWVGLGSGYYSLTTHNVPARVACPPVHP